jgi:hypothetical protein
VRIIPVIVAVGRAAFAFASVADGDDDDDNDEDDDDDDDDDDEEKENDVEAINGEVATAVGGVVITPSACVCIGVVITASTWVDTCT